MGTGRCVKRTALEHARSPHSSVLLTPTIIQKRKKSTQTGECSVQRAAEGLGTEDFVLGTLLARGLWKFSGGWGGRGCYRGVGSAGQVTSAPAHSPTCHLPTCTLSRLPTCETPPPGFWSCSFHPPDPPTSGLCRGHPDPRCLCPGKVTLRSLKNAGPMLRLRCSLAEKSQARPSPPLGSRL